MSSAAAQRMRLLRERRAAGRSVVPVEVDEADVEVLYAARLLDPMVDHSRAEIADAIKRLLKTIRCEG
jgi:hypothetical protein